MQPKASACTCSLCDCGDRLSIRNERVGVCVCVCGGGGGMT
jgi:hypothetical protein